MNRNAISRISRESRVVCLSFVMLLAAGLTGQATADPPESSGIVARFLHPGIVLFPDPEHGLAVFVNMSRKDLCSGAMAGEVDLDFKFVDTPSSAQLELMKGSNVPVYLHPIDGAPPPSPCHEAIADKPAFVGTVDIVSNDNETCPCQNNRTNSFGRRGGGTVYSTADGSRWHYAWHWRFLIDKNDEFRVATQSYRLHPVGG
jgi:hypothetical protein